MEKVTQAILFGFTALLVIAAVGDWRRYLIPNWISLAILALYPPFVLSSNLLGPTSAQVPWLASVGVATIVFIILAGLFALNKLGGGDVKMISAVSLWAGPGLIAGFFLTTSLAGGVLVLATLALGLAVIVESSLSFLGLAVQRPIPSLGNMLRDAQQFLFFPGAWWFPVIPGIAITFLIMSCNLTGDWLRDRTDPTRRQL